MDDTIISRPLPKRPATGLLAWLATIGYLGAEYSPDAMLTLRVAPQPPDQVVWSAAASWGQENVVVQERDTLPAALRDLWKAVEREHQIFKTLEAATRIPANYSQDRWVDAETDATLKRLLMVTQAAFGQEWLLIIVYQPIENPNQRVHTRLLAKDNTIHVGGTGPSIRDACLELYRNAAPGYFASAARPFDGDDLT